MERYVNNKHKNEKVTKNTNNNNGTKNDKHIYRKSLNLDINVQVWAFSV